MILANKQDIPHAINSSELEVLLDLEKYVVVVVFEISVLKDRIYIIMNVAAKKNVGVQEAFKWLEKELK